MTKHPPTSGSEHTFTTRRWGGKVGKNNNNCYAYAVNDYQRYRNWKSQPGERAKLSGSGRYVNCGKIPKLESVINISLVFALLAKYFNSS